MKPHPSFVNRVDMPVKTVYTWGMTTTRGAGTMSDTLRISRQAVYEADEIIARAELATIDGPIHTDTSYGTVYTNRYRHVPTGRVVVNEYREPVDAPHGFDGWYFERDHQIAQEVAAR